MNPEQTLKHISATSLFGRWRRRQAIKKLSRSTEPETIMILASALDDVNSHNSFILETLSKMALQQGEDGIETLWRAWVAYPKPALAELLVHIGWPHERYLDKRLAQNILAVINKSTAPATLKVVLHLVAFLPKDDADINDGLYAAWIYSQSKELEQLIEKNGHQSGSPAMETLYSLVTGQLNRYWALHDQNEFFLTQAIRLAPPEFLERITYVVKQAQNLKLNEIYRKALIQSKIEFTQLLNHLKAIGDEIGLFEQVPNMNLEQALELCERWVVYSSWINESNVGIYVQQALEAYRNIKTPQTHLSPTLPNGMIDIFTYWQDNYKDNYYRFSHDPFVRAKSLYVNQKTSQKQTGESSKHWLERLVINLTDSIGININVDPVCWLSMCKDEALLLKTNISGTPADYSRNIKLLKNINEFTTTRTLGLLVILCTFQAVFIGTEIIVETIREPSDHNAIRIDDYDGIL